MENLLETGFDKKCQEKLDALVMELDIDNLENIVRSLSRAESIYAMAKVYLLSKIHLSGKWRDNPRYSQEDFYSYINDVFDTKKKEYEYRLKYTINYPNEVRDYGFSLVDKVVRACGTTQVKRVFERIRNEEFTYSKGLRKDMIETIIEGERKIPRKTNKSWKGLYHQEVVAHRETIKELKRAQARIKKLEELLAKYNVRVKPSSAEVNA